MQLIRQFPCRLEDPRKSALAIGNFDGIHRGHLALIQQVVQNDARQVPSLMCFEPLPRTFFQPDQPVPRLMKMRDRVAICQQQGIRRLFQLRFNQAFAAQSPEQFIDDAVLAGAQAVHVVVGEDFRFGKKAAGDVDTLRQFGLDKGFSVHVLDSVMASDKLKISSSGLRKALADGDLEQATSLMGRPYRISGRVLRGQQLGRTLGFPTINLRVPEPPALSGIFAVKVHGRNTQPDLKDCPGIASLGKRPTIAGRDWLLEVNLIGFDGNLYYQHVCVDFIAKRRDETHFSTLDAMIAEMHEDVQWATELFGPQQG